MPSAPETTSGPSEEDALRCEVIASTAASRLKWLVANAAARWRFSSTWRRSVRPIWKRCAGGIRRAKWSAVSAPTAAVKAPRSAMSAVATLEGSIAESVF